MIFSDRIGGKLKVITRLIFFLYVQWPDEIYPWQYEIQPCIFLFLTIFDRYYLEILLKDVLATGFWVKSQLSHFTLICHSHIYYLSKKVCPKKKKKGKEKRKSHWNILLKPTKIKLYIKHKYNYLLSNPQLVSTSCL